jgi:excisionase family DNA binding protein
MHILETVAMHNPLRRDARREVSARGRELRDTEYPMNVRDAARFLGVSQQTVYLWVERKQIPHLRVMGRNIRFLKSDLEPFRASFRQEMENGKTT